MAAVVVGLMAGCGSRDEVFGTGTAGAGAPPAGGPGPVVPAPALGAAAPFGFFSSAALTGEGDDPNSRITGDAGTTSTASSITGFHDGGGNPFTETCPTLGTASGCGLVTGTIFASDVPLADGGATATAAAAAALAAFNDLSPAQRPGGLDVRTNSLAGAGGLPGELGGRTLAPGIYYSGAGGVATYDITTGDLTLDAQGNADAVWVFQMDSTLLVSFPTGPLLTVPRTVQPINGAQAKNVFWYAPDGATINTGSNMVGTIISNASITFGTSDTRDPPPATAITTLNGRALVLSAGATLVNTQIIVPAP
jgi:hypothetical protein